MFASIIEGEESYSAITGKDCTAVGRSDFTVELEYAGSADVGGARAGAVFTVEGEDSTGERETTPLLGERKSVSLVET